MVSPVAIKLLKCSFCQKTQQEVSRLIAGPKVHICGDCVAICNDILAQNREWQPDDPPHA